MDQNWTMLISNQQKENSPIEIISRIKQTYSNAKNQFDNQQGANREKLEEVSQILESWNCETDMKKFYKKLEKSVAGTSVSKLNVVKAVVKAVVKK